MPWYESTNCKLASFILFWLLATPLSAFAQTTYFGETTPGTTPDANNNITLSNKGGVTYSAPGVGTQQVVELSIYTQNPSTPSTGRIAIYDSAGTTLLCQGSSTFTIPASTGWVGHVGAANITPNPCNITGGSNYVLAFSVATSTTTLTYNSGSAGDFQYVLTDNTGGFANGSLSGGTGLAVRYNVRAGVSSGSSGPTVRHRRVQ